jgi:hypothetical protein
MSNGDTPPYGIIANALRTGQIVPFLGAGASAVYRPKDDQGGWNASKPYLPFGFELAQLLATDSKFPDSTSASNLPLVASYVEYVAGDRGILNGVLRNAFHPDRVPGAIHKLLAQIEEPLLIVTTNYDDLIEQAFGKKPFHLVIDRGDRSRVCVARPDRLEPVKTADLRKALQPEDLPIIYKLHGSIDKKDARNDSFLITEQDYVDFLGRADTCVPPYLAARMGRSRFLFLGYSLVDWNVRVMLRKLRQPVKSQDETLRNWAINKDPGAAERKIWEAHKVNIYNLDIRDFVAALASELGITIDDHPGSLILGAAHA